MPVYLKNQSIVGLLLRFLLEKNNAPIFSFGIFRTLKEFLDFNEFFFLDFFIYDKKTWRAELDFFVEHDIRLFKGHLYGKRWAFQETSAAAHLTHL